MKAQTKLNLIVISLVTLGPPLCLVTLTALVYLLRSIFHMSTGYVSDEWIMSGMISIPFTLLFTIPLWLVCGIIFFNIDVNDDEGPRKIPTKWDEPNPEIEALIQKVQKQMAAKKSAQHQHQNADTK